MKYLLKALIRVGIILFLMAAYLMPRNNKSKHPQKAITLSTACVRCRHTIHNGNISVLARAIIHDLIKLVKMCFAFCKPCRIFVPMYGFSDYAPAIIIS